MRPCDAPPGPLRFTVTFTPSWSPVPRGAYSERLAALDLAAALVEARAAFEAAGLGPFARATVTAWSAEGPVGRHGVIAGSAWFRLKHDYQWKKRLAAKAAADAFNAAHPAGARVRWWVRHRRRSAEGVTRDPAFVSGHVASVRLVDPPVTVPLSHVAAAPPAGPARRGRRV